MWYGTRNPTDRDSNMIMNSILQIIWTHYTFNNIIILDIGSTIMPELFDFVIWVGSWNWGYLVTWFCYQLIAKPGNKSTPVLSPDPYTIIAFSTKVYLLHNLLANKQMQQILISWINKKRKMLFTDVYSLKCKNDELCSCLDVLVNSLWPTDALCWHTTSGNGLVFDGTKPLPNQCWLVIIEVLWHTPILQKMFKISISLWPSDAI